MNAPKFDLIEMGLAGKQIEFVSSQGQITDERRTGVFANVVYPPRDCKKTNNFVLYNNEIISLQEFVKMMRIKFGVNNHPKQDSSVWTAFEGRKKTNKTIGYTKFIITFAELN